LLGLNANCTGYDVPNRFISCCGSCSYDQTHLVP